MKSLETQVGGSHYKGFVIQPLEFILKNKIGFVAGNIIKYVCRAEHKGGLEDLYKAHHYLEVLIEEAEETSQSPGSYTFLKSL